MPNGNVPVDFQSFDQALKAALQAYLENITTIDFSQPESTFLDTPTGWLNFYKIDYNERAQTVFSPFPQPARATYNIEIRLKLKGETIQTLDNTLLRLAEYVRNTIATLRINGTTINHPRYLASTVLKGIKLQNYTRDIETLATGNQNDQSDSLYQGTAILNCIYRI